MLDTDKVNDYPQLFPLQFFEARREFLNNDELAQHCVHVTSRPCSRHIYIIKSHSL